MSVGEGYVAREVCDGQRRYPGSELWTEISNLFMDFADRHGPPRLLMELALGKVKACPFNAEDIRTLKQETSAAMSRGGIEIVRTAEDRTDIPIDYRYLDALLKVSGRPGSLEGRVRGWSQTWAGSAHAATAGTTRKEEEVAAPG